MYISFLEIYFHEINFLLSSAPTREITEISCCYTVNLVLRHSFFLHHSRIFAPNIRSNFEIEPRNAEIWSTIDRNSPTSRVENNFSTKKIDELHGILQTSHVRKYFVKYFLREEITKPIDFDKIPVCKSLLNRKVCVAQNPKGSKPWFVWKRPQKFCTRTEALAVWDRKQSALKPILSGPQGARVERLSGYGTGYVQLTNEPQK